LSDHWHGSKGLKTKEIIKKGKFDIVVLQEQSMGTIINPDSVLKYTKFFCNFIKKMVLNHIYTIPEQEKRFSSIRKPSTRLFWRHQLKMRQRLFLRGKHGL
jgi:hypothetical protein